jgi:hypothetical protein
LTIHNAYVPDSYFEDYGLSPGTTYYYRVEAYSGSGSRIGESQAVSATTLMNVRSWALSPPGNIHIEWDRVGGADYYKVYRSESAGGSYTITNNGGYVPDSYFEDYGLSPGTTYFYKVEAYSYSSPDLKISESSVVWAVTLPPVPDGIPLAYKDDWEINTLDAGQSRSYVFYAVAGITYYIQWDDEYNGTGEYDCDIIVSAFMYDTNYTFFDEDDGFTNPKPVTVTDSGYVIVRVEGYFPESSGSYAIRFYEQAH